jgi:hypothetical protein
MPKHEEPQHQEFVELCALAMVGDASHEELYNLRCHLQECEDCRREYREFAQMVLPQLWAMDDGAIPSESKASVADTVQLRASFLERAQRQGIAFSPETLSAAPKAAPSRQVIVLSKRSVWYGAVALAACLTLAALVSWRFAERRDTKQPVAVAQVPQDVPAEPIPAAPVVAPPPTVDPAVAALAKLESRQQELQSALSDLETKLTAADADRAALNKQLQEKTTELAQVQTDAAASQQTVASLRDQQAALQARAQNSEADFVADQIKIHDLTDQVAQQSQAVDRERQMLAASKDMRDMMAARNLHIVDVMDTDSKGKTRTAFGRIFFAEDRQLVFYAYDLNEKRLEDARYDYRIWGQREGQPQTAKSLGIFYSDDKTERRWVFKCDDPKLLSEIDSVFVTLELSNADPNHPRGQKLMYAYLRGQANHP